MSAVKHSNLKSVPVIFIQCDWNEVLRTSDGEAWVSCKFRGETGSHGKIKSSGLSDQGVPCVTVSGGFEVKGISSRTIQVKHIDSGYLCAFIAPSKTYTELHCKSVTSLDVTSGQLGVSVCTENRLQVWETGQGAVRRVLEGHVGDVYKCRFFPSGVVILTAGADMQLKIWSAETGQCAATLQGHTAAVTDVCIVDRGRNIISVSKDGRAKLWDCGSVSCLDDLLSVNTIINCCCLTLAAKNMDVGEPEQPASGREVGTKNKLLIVGCEDGSVLGLAAYSRRKMFCINLPSAVNCITVFSSERCIVGCQNGQILLYDLNEPAVEAACWFESNSAVLSLLPYKDRGLFVGRADGTCTYMHMCQRGQDTANISDIRVQLTGSDCDPIYDIAFDGTFVYTACRDGVVRKYDISAIVASLFSTK